MRLTFTRVLFSAAVSLCGGSAAAYEPPTSLLAQLRSAKDFSGVALVATRTERPFVYLAGAARPGQAMSAHTRFDIGSIGKMLTAVAVLQLGEQGKVALDDPVGRHLPELSKPARAQTIASVMRHEAGFGDILSAPGARAASDNRDYYELVLHEPLGQPGAYAYSNSGYIVLGELIARLTGKTYEAHLQERVLGPSGMSGAVFMRADQSGDPTVAVGLIPAADPATSAASEPRGSPAEATSQTGWMTSAAGGLYARAEDLAAFGRALLTERLISRRSVDLMCPAPPPDTPMAYGLGCMVMRDGGFGHNGERPGMEALLLISRRADAVVVTLSNHDQQAEPVFWPIWEAVTVNPRE